MLQTFFQNTNKQVLSKYAPQLQRIKTIGNRYSKLTDEELKLETATLKNRLQSGQTQDDIIAEAFALVSEATYRVLNIRHYDVQLIGGLVLNEGKIAEMKTGEGKTIVALLPTFLNALSNKGTHVVTVNDYLARRDAEYVGQVHQFLGLSIGLIQENMSPEERKQNYNCDVVYVTNNELGFDYLRDNMAFTSAEMVQRPFYFAVVDEVDSILIDEARTPLIISGPSEAPTQKYLQTSKLAPILKRDIHYSVDEKNQNVILLEDGIVFCEQALNLIDLYNPEDPWISYILNSIKAKELFKLNTNYIINEQGEIVIVDEFTGRTMYGRRWSDGLHQAVEAKENVKIQDESQTLASITYQNLFLLYDKLSGMTGTSKTEELEFEKIYNLKVVQIPTHKPIKRKDFPDLIYKNQYIKWQAIANECVEMYQLGRPVLVGTTTIEKSELLAALLNEYNVPYQLLNAKPENVEKESEIVAQAGCKNAVTISTNMAGRGTDIVLGGNAENLAFSILTSLFGEIKDNTINEKNEPLQTQVQISNREELNEILAADPNLLKDFFKKLKTGVDTASHPLQPFYKKLLEGQKEVVKTDKTQILELGGLHVIGTERHESRRIDNQLRGRAGRQGDPGSSRFFLSLEDKLLRLFGGEQILDLMQNIGFQEDTPIQSPLLNQSLESAQRKVEAYYFDTRKQLFEYDQALTLQRTGIYIERRQILQRENVRDWIIEYAERSLYDLLRYSQQLIPNEKEQEIFSLKVQELLGLPFRINLGQKEDEINTTLTKLQQQFQITYDLKEIEIESIEKGLMRELERTFLLQQIDYSWKEHLQKISFLRDSIRWRAYGQKNPLTEYKKEAFNFFITMLTRIRHRVVYFVLRSKILLK